MNIRKLRPAGVIDAMLEATIIGSFTKLGYGARDSLYDWDQTPADMTGKSVALTGGTSGIGKETVDELLALGADVHLTSRDTDRAEDTAGELNQSDERGPGIAQRGKAVGHELDTGSFGSIRAFVSEITAATDRVDVLINNAGALTAEYQTDDRGVELTLSTHLIGHYLLTTELRAAMARGGLVLFMSSGGMYTQGLDVDRLEMSEEEYKGAVAYARAKRAQVELVHHLAPKWSPKILMHSVHPGWVATDGVDSGLPGFGKLMGPLLRSAEQGADTMVWLAATGGDGAEPGQFWLDRRPRGTTYLPGTGTTPAEREKLVDWLERQVDGVDQPDK